MLPNPSSNKYCTDVNSRVPPPHASTPQFISVQAVAPRILPLPLYTCVHSRRTVGTSGLAKPACGLLMIASSWVVSNGVGSKISEATTNEAADQQDTLSAGLELRLLHHSIKDAAAYNVSGRRSASSWIRIRAPEGGIGGNICVPTTSGLLCLRSVSAWKYAQCRAVHSSSFRRSARRWSTPSASVIALIAKCVFAAISSAFLCSSACGARTSELTHKLRTA
mmetsp:Transcript_56701/g.151250  ORF Transcript_56701/g.151250 Transcript_56701/m.151250 type:complete len:222 (-) Transcript_56701:620-1285(-)